MSSDSDLKIIHKILLKIAESFHQVCENNKIQYYMLGGTMLGAIRHKGFIPWDDDMDFGVMAEDWSKLIEALNKELPQYYRVRDIKNTRGISNPSIKIEDARTIIKETDKPDECDVIGINIDVFPLNYTNERKNLFSKNGLIEKLIRLNLCRFLDYKSKPLIKRVLSNVFKATLFPFPKDFLVSIIQKYLVTNNGTCITNYWGAWINKEIVSAEVMGRPAKYVFEDTYFWGVAIPDEYLKHLYGDYMKIPPKDKIHYHVLDWKYRDDCENI